MQVSLDRLFGSRTRAKLLTLFTGGVRRPYYVRELSRVVSERVNSIRREVENLRRIGLLTSHLRSGKKFYAVNPQFPLIEEIARLTGKGKRGIEDRLFDGLRRIGTVQLVLLTGVFTQAKRAPTDILIVGDVKESLLQQHINAIEEELGREVNFTVMPLAEFEYRRSMNDQFLRQVFDGRPVELVNQLANRVLEHA